MALPALARLVMIVRSSMIDELNQQYVKTCFAKGLSFYRVVGVHALRNAALPVVTLCGWELIRAVAGYSVVVETVFAWPGLGLTAMQAIERNDLILLQAIVFTVAILVVLISSPAVWSGVSPRVRKIPLSSMQTAISLMSCSTRSVLNLARSIARAPSVFLAVSARAADTSA